MERLLLSLDVDAPNPDDLNAIFRAAHSIKGGSGTFGFTDMTGVTHILETLLDRLRKNELALRSEMVDAFLEAGDVLREQLGRPPEQRRGRPPGRRRSMRQTQQSGLRSTGRRLATCPSPHLLPHSGRGATRLVSELEHVYHIEFTPDQQTLDKSRI